MKILFLLLALIGQGSAHACVRVMMPDGKLTDCFPEPPGQVLYTPKCSADVAREFKTQFNVVLSVSPSTLRWRNAKERMETLTKQCF